MATVCAGCLTRPVENIPRSLCKRCCSWVSYHATRCLRSDAHWDRYNARLDLANTRIELLEADVDRTMEVRVNKGDLRVRHTQNNKVA